MTKAQGFSMALVVAALTGMTGCAANTPVSTAPQASGTRHVMGIDNPLTRDQLMAAIPQRLTPEQAKGVLVRIDPSKVVDKPHYSTMLLSYSPYFYGGYSPYYLRSYSSFYYYPYSNYYYPYYYSSGYYYPYTYLANSYYYSPFYYNYSGLYYPYYYRR
jgi:hypothetical protein